MLEISKISTLNRDVLNIIFSLLHSAFSYDLRNVRLVCKLWKALADPFMYRVINLNEDPAKVSITTGISELLLDHDKDLSRHVRELRILNPYIEAYGKRSRPVAVVVANELAADKLTAIVEQLDGLQHFWWDVDRDIPDPIFTELQKRPHIRITIGNHNRHNINIQQLSSPQVQSLKYRAIYGPTVITNRRFITAWPQLRKILLRNPNLRKLEVEVDANLSPEATRNLPLTTTDRLPPLEELIFRSKDVAYKWKLDHCLVWKQCMDWSHLRRLNLSTDCPQFFIEAIGPSLINLQSLTMGVRIVSVDTYLEIRSMRCVSLDIVVDFLDSLPRLLELDLVDDGRSTRVMATAILERQKLLRKLSYHTSSLVNVRVPVEAYVWTITQVQSLRDACRDLTELGLDFPLVEGKWPDEYANTVATFNRLHRLKVHVNLSEEASDFIDEYHQDELGSVPMPDLKVDVAQDVSAKLFRSFFSHNPYAHLESLEVCFRHHLQEDRGARWSASCSVKLRRLVRNDAPSPLDGGFEVECDGRWLSRRTPLS